MVTKLPQLSMNITGWRDDHKYTYGISRNGHDSVTIAL